MTETIFWYEGYKISDTFWTPFSDYQNRIGEEFTVVRRMNEEEVDDVSYLPMWIIRFKDGKEINAYPEEIIKEEINKLKVQIEKETRQ